MPNGEVYTETSLTLVTEPETSCFTIYISIYGQNKTLDQKAHFSCPGFPATNLTC